MGSHTLWSNRPHIRLSLLPRHWITVWVSDAGPGWRVGGFSAVVGGRICWGSRSLGALPADEKTPSALSFSKHFLIITLSRYAELEGLGVGGVIVEVGGHLCRA